jgi:hypothetical protein
LCQNDGLLVSSLIRETEKVAWVEDDSHVVFGKKNSLVKKEVLDGAKSSHIFTQSPENVTVACKIDCLACHDEFFVNNPLNVKEND